MNMLLKPTTVGARAHACGHRCCTDIRGKNVKLVRRAMKRSERQAWKKENAR